MPYFVYVHPRALLDIRSAVARTRLRVSAASATRLGNALWKKLFTLADRPDRCPQAYEAPDLGIDLRELLHGRRPHVYRILFTIAGDTVHIHRVRHAAQDRIDPESV